MQNATQRYEHSKVHANPVVSKFRFLEQINFENAIFYRGQKAQFSDSRIDRFMCVSFVSFKRGCFDKGRSEPFHIITCITK